jgi:sRNA-binding protein
VKLAALALLCAAAFPAAAQMYKCVDERGVTPYSDKPRPGCQGGEVNIQGSPPASGALQGRQDDISRQNADFSRRQIERERAESQEKKVRETRCARMRLENARLSSGLRSATITPQGERIYLEDASRDARLAQLKEELRGCP